MQMNTKNFSGFISKGNEKLPIDFSVSIDVAGEASISLGSLELGAPTQFIEEGFNARGSRFEEFSLEGVSSDESFFQTQNLIFLSLRGYPFEDNVVPVVDYSTARMIINSGQTQYPVITWKLKNFRTFTSLTSETPVGKLVVGGSREEVTENAITGFIRIDAISLPEDIEKWKCEVDGFCRHVQKVLSFASNVELVYPIIEFAHQGRVEIDLYSRGQPRRGVWAPLHWLHLKDFFACAVQSYFSPPFEVKKLSFAIDWFNMHGTHAELNLISAMTVLESLIDSNLSKSEKLQIGDKKFKELRGELSEVVKLKAEEWFDNDDERGVFISDLNSRFLDLQRKSLLQKMELLSIKWKVPLDDIDSSFIRGAKTARDHVVHRGHYAGKEDEPTKLHDHVLIVREIVVRFIFAALGFNGRYESYVGGYHSAEFKSAIK
jgi:hypothetical protein